MDDTIEIWSIPYYNCAGKESVDSRMVDTKSLGKFAVALCALLLFVVAGTQEGYSQAFQDTEVVTVAKFEINGNQKVSRTDIVLEIPFKVGDEITVPDDLLRAEIKLRDMGYFQDVASEYRVFEDGEGIVVMMEVFENPVISEIEVTGNRNWNDHRQIDLLGLSMPWPFTDYVVSPNRMFDILEKHGIKRGEVFNTRGFQRALGIDENGACRLNPPSPSICKEYNETKEYLLFGIGGAEPGKVVKISVIEGVFETVEIKGVEGPFLDKALELIQDIPVLRPVKRPDVQAVLQNLATSVFFEPFSEQDLEWGQGTTPERLTLTLNVKPNQLISEPTEINLIDFVGNEAFATRELQSRVEFEGGLVDNYGALEAIEGVHRFYRKEGFIMTQVTQENLVNGILTLRVNEGRIGEIEIRQNGYPTAIIRNDFEIEYLEPSEGELPFDPFRDVQEPPDANHDEEAEGEDHLDEVSPVESEDAEQPMYIQYVQKFADFLGDFLGTTASSGLPFTQPEIIIKELDFEPGEYLNQFHLAETYRTLLDLKYFKDVQFDFQPIENSDDFRVVIDVREQDKLGDFRFGGSVSQDGLVGQLSVHSKNLHGTGQDVGIELDRGLLGKSVVTWSLDYQSRTMIESADYVNVKLYDKTTKEKSPKSHFLHRIGGEASLAYPISDLQIVLGLRHENFTKEFELGEDEEGDPEIENGASNVLSLTANHDDRNNPIFATRGGRRSFTVERAGLFAGSEEFTKAWTALIQHLPTVEDQTIAARVVAGWGEDLPSQEKFVMGGSATLRGIKPEHVDSMAYMNLEYRILVEQNFSIAFFADGGAILGGEEIELKKSIGIEGRITIPYVGPIRVAFAWPITDKLEYFKVEFGFGTLF
jgi:outer membrane protein assembly factor BamA